MPWDSLDFDPATIEWNPVETALLDGLADHVATAAALVVGEPGRPLFSRVMGRVSDEPGAGPAGPDSLFDLASLTKPLATALACLVLVEEGRLDLFEPVGRRISLPPDRSDVTAAHLLAHTSGLPAWRPFYRDLAGRPGPERTTRLAELLNNTELQHRPGERTVYSDLGYLLLQVLIEKITGQGLARFLESTVYEPLCLELGFVPLPPGPGPAGDRYVATEHCPLRGRLLKGEVNDENAWALGGVGGQAGLFGTAETVFRLMGWLAGLWQGRAEAGPLKPATARLLLEKPFAGQAAGQPRTLGFDQPAEENPSCGRLFSREAVGHLGFVGTSIWCEPCSGLIVVLLTNRTIFGRANQKIRRFRPLIHDRIRAVLAGAGYFGGRTGEGPTAL